jgi:NUDIX domain
MVSIKGFGQYRHAAPSVLSLVSRMIDGVPVRSPRVLLPCEDYASEHRAEHISRLLQSRVGRDLQRYDGMNRLLACVVVVDKARSKVLLISSSKHLNEWILPKGGWEQDETVEECAVREAEEEAGVRDAITSS